MTQFSPLQKRGDTWFHVTKHCTYRLSEMTTPHLRNTLKRLRDCFDEASLKPYQEELARRVKQSRISAQLDREFANKIRE